jgi:Complex I intermediate-associated protein 30 (CIA30)
MGGKSSTNLVSNHETLNHMLLHFHGTINTNGGGFTSIRTKIVTDRTVVENDHDKEKHYVMIGFKIRYQGDGKTYKFFITNRETSSPSWQVDIPTLPKVDIMSSSSSIPLPNDTNEHDWEERTIYLDQLVPFFGPATRRRNNHNISSLSSLDMTQMNEMGFMLSLKLSNGNPNPIETFGTGIFPFHLFIHSIEILYEEL